MLQEKDITREDYYLMGRMIAIFLSTLLLSSCAVTHKITYNMDNVVPSRNEVLSGYVLDLQDFEDARKGYIENKILFATERKWKLTKSNTA